MFPALPLGLCPFLLPIFAMASLTPAALASAEDGSSVTLRSLAVAVKLTVATADALWAHLDLDPDDPVCVEAASEIPQAIIDKALNDFSNERELSVGAKLTVSSYRERLWRLSKIS